MVHCDMCHAPKSLTRTIDFNGKGTATEAECNNAREIKCNTTGNIALPAVLPTTPAGLAARGSFDLESMEQGSSTTISKAPLDVKCSIRQYVPLRHLSRKQKLAIRRHRWQRRVQPLTLPLVPQSAEPTWVWRRAEMDGREEETLSPSAVVVPGSPGYVAG